MKKVLLMCILGISLHAGIYHKGNTIFVNTIEILAKCDSKKRCAEFKHSKNKWEDIHWSQFSPGIKEIFIKEGLK